MRASSFFPFFGRFELYVCWPFFGLPFLSPLGWFWPLIFYWIFVSIQFHSLDLEPISPNKCLFKSQKSQLQPVGLTLQRGNLPPLVQGKSTPDIEIGINLVPRLVLP
jgi:hypothetical protein